MHKAQFTLLVALPFSLSTASSKRGLVHIPNGDHPADDNIWVEQGSDLTWYYNYNVEPSTTLEGAKFQFVPMLWGAPDNGSDTGFYGSVSSQIQGGANVTHVLAFNEPDGTSHTGGSAISVELAASIWKREIEPLKKLGVKLGAPAVSGSPDGSTWLQGFFTECDGGCSVDFIPVHWYGNFEGLTSYISQLRAKYMNMTIWITEYAYPNVSLEETQSFYNQSAEYFDGLDFVTHYSYFGAFRSDDSNVGPNVAFLTTKGELTDIGSWYLGGSATGKTPSAANIYSIHPAWFLAIFSLSILLVI